MFHEIETVCPYCGVGCRMILRESGGRIQSVIPSPSGVNQGKLCIKGWSAHEFIHHEDRLTAPLVRNDRDSVFEETGWDDALDRIQRKLSQVLDESGPQAAAFFGSAKCTNEDNYALQKFARAVCGSPNIDHCARLCHASTVVGLNTAFGSGAMTNSIDDLEQADAIFIVGSNTSEQHPLIARRILRAVRDNGATLIVLDPRRIDLVDFAEIHLQNRPGTDIALINGLLKVIIDEGLEDVAFIEERTEGFDAFKEHLSSFTKEAVSEITGAPADSIVQAARILGKAERAAIVYAMGVTQRITGTDTVLALANLAMATGNVGRPGTGVNPLRGQNNVQGACDVGVLPNVYPGYQLVADGSVREFFNTAWETDRLPESAGLTLCEIMDAALDGRIRFLYILGENPALSDPDIRHVRKALESVEFLVVQDIFPTETSAFAHVVLPGASFAEKDGTFTSTERRVQLVRKAVDPPGEARQEWQVFSELAQNMGYGGMNWSNAREVFEDMARVTPQYRGLTFDRLDPDGLQWPCPDESHPGTPYLHRDGFTRGKGRFVPVDHRPPDELPDSDYPMSLITGRILFHYHTGTLTRRSPTLTAQVDEPYVEINPKDAADKGVQQGQMVKVTSRRGEITLKAFITETVSQDVVFIPFHFAEAAANMLTNRALDPQAKIPELKVCAVRLEAIV